MLNEVCTLPNWEHAAIILIANITVLLVEAKMGTTKYGSLIGFIFNKIVSMLGRKQ